MIQSIRKESVDVRVKYVLSIRSTVPTEVVFGEVAKT